MSDKENMFARLSPEPAPHELGIPDGYSAPLDIKTTTERMAERDAWFAATVRCPCCEGKGRVLKDRADAANAQTTAQERK